MTRFADNDLTCNAFLGGKVRLHQPVSGYRAGVDPVLLAAAVPARAGQKVLELGCGAGQALFCLSARVPQLSLTGVELQPEYADLARRNAEENGCEVEVWEADIRTLPTDLRQRQFDHVIANPPYYRAGSHSAARDPGRATALGDTAALEEWVETAARRLAPKGYLHVIQRADRLPELLAGCAGRLGSVEVLPLAPRIGREPELILLRARKAGKAPFRLHAAKVLHTGDRHERDEDHYTPEIAAILRQGASLIWPK
jgi:tRNA1(Val) A37 N6-methylase TrmN6